MHLNYNIKNQKMHKGRKKNVKKGCGGVRTLKKNENRVSLYFDGPFNTLC